MTPIDPTPGNNFSSGPPPKPTQPAWQVWAIRIVSLAVALYMIFGVILPNARERMKDDHGQNPQASAQAQ